MAIETSNQVILISDNSRTPITLKKVLNNNDLEINSDYLNLSSLPLIKKIIGNTKNTAFIRTEYLKFIKEKGNPFFIALDYKINCGLPDELDPDNLKILRTFLISLTILSRGKGFEGIKGNILILTKNENHKSANSIDKNPHSIIDLIQTKDPIVNKFIDQLKNDKNEFNKLFYIKVANIETHSGEFNQEVENFIQGIKARNSLKKPEDNSAKMSSENNPPATILYKLDDTKIYADGQLIEAPDEKHASLKAKQIYVDGFWTNKTQMEVSKKILEFIKKGIDADNKFAPEDKLNIILDENAKLDASTAPSLVQLLARDLDKYQITIKVSSENNVSLQSSEGYKLIKKQVQEI